MVNRGTNTEQSKLETLAMSLSQDFVFYKNKYYPKFQTEGNAAQFIYPFAKAVCKGEGLDIGCAKKEWALPWARPIDSLFNDGFDAYNLPPGEFDFIFSSHCLEHLEDWVYALEYWIYKLKLGGNLLLYLPHYDQEYWRPWNNRKHYHAFTPEILNDFFLNHIDICKDTFYITGKDLNYSFAIYAHKSSNKHYPQKHKVY